MSRFAFFRESGWLLVATLANAAFMWAVHLVAPGSLGKGAYGLFNTLLPILGFTGIPALGIQAILAQQTAGVLNEGQMRQLRGTVRLLAIGVFGIWFIAAIIVFFGQSYIAEKLKINNPTTLWVTLVAALFMLWIPICLGVLQGQQKFSWFGIVGITGGVGRFLGIVIIVVLLGYGITGALFAVLLGVGLSLALGVWQTRAIWAGPRDRVDWREWFLGRVVPLTVGVGATTLILNADIIMVRMLFEENQTGLYSAAGILGRALAYFAGPMTQVMFPKVVQSAARAERTNVVAQAVVATAFLGGIGALACSFAPRLPLRIIYPPEYLAIEPLVPLFAWAVLPLALSNVLINNLLARGKYGAVWWLFGLAILYAITLAMLYYRLDVTNELVAFKTIVWVLLGFGSVVFGVCCWFTWRTTEHGQSRPVKEGAVA